MKSLLTLLLSFVAATALAIGNYNINDELYVHAPSGLKLRNVPDGETVLATVPYGAKLKVVETRNTSTPAKTVDGLKGYWAKISYEGKTGYIFDGYLSFLPTPKPGQNLYTYCKTFFKVASDSLVQYISCDAEVSDETAIRLFSFGNRKVVYSTNSGYEWGGEGMTIQGLSLEEGYLLAKTIYKDDFERSLKYYKEHPEQGTGSNGGVIDLEIFTTFKHGQLPNHCFSVEFQSECSDMLEVVQRNGVLYIHRWGGC